MTRSTSIRRGARPGQRGFAASVIVLALVAVLAALVMGNTRVVHSLQREIRQVEQRQLRQAAIVIAPEPVAPAPGSGGQSPR